VRVLLVRLGALGDIVHAIPAAAAIRRTWPEVELDWLVEPRYEEVLRHVFGITRRITIDTRGSRRALLGRIGELRARRYDLAIDLQGLVKSAVLTRLSGALRVVGFAKEALREPIAGALYGEHYVTDNRQHVLHKNLALLRAIGADASRIEFPFDVPPLREPMPEPLALVNPGAGWPNKRWPVDRFGALARWLADEHGFHVRVLWGPGEQAVADAVVEAAGGRAVRAPATTIGDLLALARRARIFISGDTGPMHLAAAVGTPIVGIFGPTDAARNGPFTDADVSVSRFATCICHHERRCRRPEPCVSTIELAEVQAAVTGRLATTR